MRWAQKFDNQINEEEQMITRKNLKTALLVVCGGCFLELFVYASLCGYTEGVTYSAPLPKFKLTGPPIAFNNPQGDISVTVATNLCMVEVSWEFASQTIWINNHDDYEASVYISFNKEWYQAHVTPHVRGEIRKFMPKDDMERKKPIHFVLHDQVQLAVNAFDPKVGWYARRCVWEFDLGK